MRSNLSQKICQSSDWHQAEISAELKKIGTSVAALSKKNGLSRHTLRNVFYRHYPKSEQIIAQAIGVEPKDIWPSRYQQTI